jgi:hypothetical protein
MEEVKKREKKGNPDSSLENISNRLTPSPVYFLGTGARALQALVVWQRF